MSLSDVITLASSKNGVSIGVVVLIILASLIQVSKIPFNPWDKIFGWLGDRLNGNLNKRLDSMDKKIDGVDKKIDKHIEESETKDLQDTRRDILEFANACMNGRKHTKEQFDFVISECDNYEAYIETHKVKNGVVTSAIREIRRLNANCLHNNTYLKEWEYYSKDGDAS